MRVLLLFSTMVFLLTACSHDSGKKVTTANEDSSVDGSEKSLSMKSGFQDVNGIKMYYEIYGKGPDLVLLHGGGSTIQTSFGRMIPELSKGHRVIAVELQAHGHTSDRKADLSFEQDADDVAMLLELLHVDSADVFGFSNGGTTALQLAIRHPERVKKIICASALFKRNGAPPQFWEFMKHATLEQMPKQYKDAYLEITSDTAKLNNMHDKCAKRMIEFNDISDAQLKSVKASVLLVNGTEDVASSEHVLQMAKLIPDCRFAILPGAHGGYMGEVTTLKAGDALTVLPVLENFLR